MDLREKRQLDLAAQMARVKNQTRPWRAIIAFIFAVISGIVATQANFPSWAGADHLTEKLVRAAAAVGFCVFAVVGVVGLAGKSRDVLIPRVGSAHAAVVRYSILLVGGAATLIFTLELAKVPVGQLIVGGAVTTILIGIAAQQSLSNVFAGIVLLLSRPFAVGDFIRVKSGALGGLIEGNVTEIGITYVRIDAPDGILHVPNSQVLAAAVGPAAATSRPGADDPAGTPLGGPPGTPP
ncbi:MAG TPA: mechanosensitive ion channel domain-containing protein [Streptosporangiaceae bacterium]|nr:mechanosensitive ion channel domain-containing protein [Streptosporangiaceae bacterium]